eukprot:scaffold63449_cov66-Phaeocystis_antarctica.AAC.2
MGCPECAPQSGGNARGSRPCQCSMHGVYRRITGRDGSAAQKEPLKRRQRAPVERGSQGVAADVGDLGVHEAEQLELLQPSSRRRRRTCRRRRRTCRRRRRHEGGEALVAERVAPETEVLQRGPPPQGRREGHQPRVADGGVAQVEGLESRQGASAQGGGERRGACVAHVHIAEKEPGHGWQRARAQPLRQPLHAVGAGCWLAEVQLLERWQHRAQRAQHRQVVRGEARVVPPDLLRLAQLLAAPQPHLAA